MTATEALPTLERPCRWPARRRTGEDGCDLGHDVGRGGDVSVGAVTPSASLLTSFFPSKWGLESTTMTLNRHPLWCAR